MRVIEQSAQVLWPGTPKEAEKQLRLVEYAGRNCYRSHGKTTDDSYHGFIERLAQRGHTAPLEFGHVMIQLVTGRDVMAEITRHRHASFCIQSQRYVLDDKSGEISFIRPQFYIPSGGDKSDAKMWCASRMWDQAMEQAEESYKYLHNTCGLPAQDARKVLPNSTATIIIMGCNLRELIHVLRLRTSQAAYPEMRVLMQDLSARLADLFPDIIRIAMEEEQ